MRKKEIKVLSLKYCTSVKARKTLKLKDSVTVNGTVGQRHCHKESLPKNKKGEGCKVGRYSVSYIMTTSGGTIVKAKWTTFIRHFSNLSITQSASQQKSAFTHLRTHSHNNGRWLLYTVPTIRNSYTFTHRCNGHLEQLGV